MFRQRRSCYLSRGRRLSVGIEDSRHLGEADLDEELFVASLLETKLEIRRNVEEAENKGEATRGSLLTESSTLVVADLEEFECRWFEANEQIAQMFGEAREELLSTESHVEDILISEQ